MSEKFTYVCNGSPYSYKCGEVEFPKKTATKVAKDKAEEMYENDFMFKDLVDRKILTCENEIPDEYKTQGQQLVEATDTVVEKDREIAALKAKIAELEGKNNDTEQTNQVPPSVDETLVTDDNEEGEVTINPEV